MTPRNLTTGTESELFPGQLDQEEVLIFVRRHWMAYLPWAFILLVMLVMPPVVVVSLAQVEFIRLSVGSHIITTAFVVGTFYLFTNAVFLTSWIEHYLDVAILTRERLVLVQQIGLFNRRIAELSLLRVQDVSAQMQGYLQTLLRYGSVVVESAGEAPNFVMQYVPRPHVVANTILMLHDQLMTVRPVAAGSSMASVQARSEESLIRPEGGLGGEFRRREVHAPLGFDHDHLNEDLLTQAKEVQEHVAAFHGGFGVSGQPAGTSSLAPNRLPKEAEERRELVEGEDVSVETRR
ncbi:PH domain-containing protein [Candidatus Berkelbacteria bacterium]|nr:PH domain-containing protein [Candidatus Berkelbacteria bacterium]